MHKAIDYPREGYFYKGKLLNGKSFSSDINGCYGFRTWEDCAESLSKYLVEHKDEIDYIEGPYIGVYD